jgi:hypothetical protein
MDEQSLERVPIVGIIELDDIAVVYIKDDFQLLQSWFNCLMDQLSFVGEQHRHLRMFRNSNCNPCVTVSIRKTNTYR